MGVNNQYPEPKAVKCPNCQTVHQLLLHDQSLCFICSNCQTSVSTFNLSQINKLRASARKFYLELGAFGTIKNTKFQVVGMLTKSDGAGSYWNEYTLYNPIKGYIWLTTYEGNWTYIETMSDPPLITHLKNVAAHEKIIEYDGDQYTKFLMYKSRIVGGHGEFSYPIEKKEDGNTIEYIKPPKLISFYRSSDEIKWFKGEYLEPDEVRKGFKLTEMPIKNVQGYLEIFKQEKRFKYAFVLYLVSVLLVIGFMQLNNLSKEKGTVLAYSSHYDTVSTQMKKIGEFSLNDDNNILEFQIEGPLLNNQWMDIEFEMIEKKTGEAIYFVMPLEYYQGYDGGEYWTEGSRDDYEILSSVNKGDYVVSCRPTGMLFNDHLEYNIKIEKNATVHRNWILFILLAGLGPLIQYFIKRNFEVKRWNQSNVYDE